MEIYLTNARKTIEGKTYEIEVRQNRTREGRGLKYEVEIIVTLDGEPVKDKAVELAVFKDVARLFPMFDPEDADNE